MPLVRFEVRNEVGLGDPELYGGGGGGGGGKRGEAEPKALLEGVAVAGLVGILRQLGDLAEFAADVFHDLHEQVITTSARGRRVLTRVQNIEAALPSLEKAVKNQKSHIHFAYVPGSDWHAQLQNEQNQLLSSDLPRFMMDSYEECRDPPRLYLLDKFDNAGAGACLKRYSDPFYFKRAWDMTKIDKSRNVQREKRTQKVKRKGSRLKNGESYHGQTTSRLRNGELQQVVGAARHTSRRFTSPSMDGYSFSENRSTPDARSNPEIVSRSSSFGSKAKLTSVEQALDTKPAVVPPESSHEKPSDVKLQYKLNDASSSVVLNGASMKDSNIDSKKDSLTDEMVVRSPSVKWDEKAEITMSTSSVYCDDVVMDKTQDAEPIHINLARKEIDHREMENLEQQEVLLQKAKLLLVSSGLNHHDEIPSETDNYMDALNTLESETETEVECQTKNHMKSVPQAGAIENLVSQHPDSSLAEVHDTCQISDTCHTSEKPGDIHDLSNADPTEISEPALSVYTAIPPNKGSSVINHMSNVEEASQDSTDQETGCTASFEHTNMQANEPSEIVSVAKSSPVDATDGTPDISESKAQDSPGKNDREGLGCGAPSISDMQTMSSNESLDKGPATQDGPSNISDTSLGVSSIKLWTNAGLFGLEPSKPPVFGARDGPSEDILPCSKEPQCSHSTDYTELHSSKVPESALVDVPNGNASITSSFMGKLVGIRPISANHSSSGLDQSATRTSHIVQTNGPVDCSTSFEHSEQKNMIDKLNSVSLLEISQDNAENGVHMYPAERLNTSVVSDLPLTSKANPEYHHSFDSSMSISSSFSSIAQRFLANTLQRRTAPKYTDLPASSERVNCDASAADEATPICNPNISPNGTVLQSSQFEENKENNTNGLSTTSIFSSCHYSEQSSPPLEYMKISFHPMNAFEMSKLDVEFSDGNFHENAVDLMLPFQLPPGSSVPLPGSGSESEDDTFGRSYSYSSYDDLSPHLYSNSELWDQEEEIGMEENELYNNSNQTGSSATLISSTMCFEQLNSAVKITDTLAEMGDQNERAALESYTAGELPNFDTLMSTNNQQNGDAFMQCNPANLSFENEDLLPPPPPLPPVQWRTTKPTSSLGEDTGINAKDGLKKSLSLPPLHGPIVQEDRFPPATPVAPPQPQGAQHAKNVHDQKVDMVKELNHLPCISEIKASLLQQIRDKPDQQKLNGHEKPKAIGGDTKPLDEREELLQQIRTKTFNLRRADTTKPNGLSQSNANSSVVAILEKANAIRQAVASDEGGDDDNWSDI